MHPLCMDEIHCACNINKKKEQVFGTRMFDLYNESVSLSCRMCITTKMTNS